ncbi:MAG: type II toxin-antitoxin system RelE/ParE family toxin [Planctomycetes bacterium]|nr:type II toxin-antitoxin system RelE/ParE family toxin [Planctomycetota bacterium]
MIVSPTARQDLSDIFDFIATDKPIAAANWVEKIEEKCKLISTMPDFGESRPEYGAGIRSSVLGRYVIFYRAITGGIEIARVIPGDRDIRSL